MKGSETYDKERAHFNLGRIRKAGDSFEVIIDPDAAVSYREGSVNDVREVLKYEKIFSDARKGLIAPAGSMERAFSTSDPLKVADVILKDGQVHLTSEYRESLRAAKHSQLVQLIHRNSIDPRTKLPHPVTRIENAFAEAKVKVDERKSAESQLDEVIRQLAPVLPIHFETRKLEVLVPSSFASKSMGLLKGYGRLVRNAWHSDGTLFAVVEIPAGLQQDLIDRLNKLAHGNVDVKVVGEG